MIHPRDTYGEIEWLHNLAHGEPDPPELPQVDGVIFDEVRKLTPTGSYSRWWAQFSPVDRYLHQKKLADRKRLLAAADRLGL